MKTAETVALEKAIRRATYKMGTFGCYEVTIGYENYVTPHRSICELCIVAVNVTAAGRGKNGVAAIHLNTKVLQ